MKKILALVLLWTSVAAFAQITYTDYSGSITTGGTSQTLAPASNGRVRIAILNPATETENLCVNLTVAASCTPGTSWILQSGQSVVIDSTEVVTVVAATTGHKWVAKAGVGAGFAANGGGSGSGGGGGAVTNAGTFAVQPAGSVAHDGVATGVNPVLTGGYASAAAPTNVSADGDSVRDWSLRSGAKVTQPSYGGVLASAGSGVNGTGVPRVTIATDDTLVSSLATKLDTLAATNTQLPSAATVATATLANVAASASNVTCLASNASRLRAIIFNDSATATLYVKPGATASTTSFTWQVPPGGTLTLDNLPVYTGILDCIWSAASGNARVTEF